MGSSKSVMPEAHQATRCSAPAPVRGPAVLSFFCNLFWCCQVVVRWIDKDGAKENYAEEKVILSIMDKDTFTRDDALGK